MTRSEPRCPACGWHLSFDAHEGRWSGCCWNPSCARGEVHPTTPVEAEVLRLAERHGALSTAVLCSELGLKQSAASMRLKTMEAAGILARERVVPVRRGGAAYVYRVAA